MAKRNSLLPALSPAKSSDRPRKGRSGQSLDYILFILLNAILFLRPAECVPSLEGLPIYSAVIICSVVTSFGKILPLVRIGSLSRSPISVCVVGLLPAVILSHLTHGYLGGALDSLNEFYKIVIYYFLLISTLDSESRLEGFLSSLCFFIVVVSLLSISAYYGWIDLPAFAPYQDWYTDPVSGEELRIPRLQAVGIFGNPNDFSRILLLGMAICLLSMSRGEGLTRWFWVAPLLLFGNAFALTRSRGAFLSLLAGILAFFAAKYGRKAAIPVLITVPLLFVLFAGRQTEISTDSGTGQSRIQIWNEGFQLLLQYPLFGIGMNEYTEQVRHNAHNSFLQCYTELGLFGGTLFFGANYFALVGLIWYRKASLGSATKVLVHLQPYLLGMVVLYQVGMLTSNRSYSLPTYMVVGLAAVFVQLVSTKTLNGTKKFNTDIADVWFKAAICGLLFLSILYVFVRFSARYGG